MTYRCPWCGHNFDASELQQPAGIGGGSYCPKCQNRVYLSFAYQRTSALISLLIAVGILALLHTRNVLGFLIGAILIWIPVSMFLNVMSSRYRAPKLKRWKPRRRRTFFEWLYERDEPPELFDTKSRPKPER